MSTDREKIKLALDKLYKGKSSHSAICGRSYTFNKKNNRCIKKTQKKPRAKSRNKPNQLQQNKTQRNKNVINKLEQRLKRLFKNTSPPKKATALNKRCPKGTRRNKKTMTCEPHQKNIKSKKKSGQDKPIVLSDTTTRENRTIATAISKLVRTKGVTNKLTSAAVLQKLPITVKKLPSFSPEVNQQLVTIREDVEIHDIFGCGIEDVLEKPWHIEDKYVLPKLKNKLNIPVGVQADGSLKCVGGFTKKGQKILLDNLRLSKKLDCSSIVTPLQIQSNCWFNTMFMTFFISDKGRKFFRYFRQMMITGKKLGGQNINPVKLRYSFFLLNASIEACYNKTSLDNPINRTNWTLALDTNNLIRYIYESIPNSKRNTAIVEPGELNNPLSYYKGMIQYLGDDSISIGEIKINSSSDVILYSNLIENGFVGAIDKPDVIAMHIMDNTSQDMYKPLSFIYNESKYELDSVVVRDTSTSHFCAVLTCNKKEYGYDGASFSRISPFNWRDVLNKNKKWTFKGSVFVDERGNPTSSKIYWNFKKAYQVLYYYRTD